MYVQARKTTFILRHINHIDCLVHDQKST